MGGKEQAYITLSDTSRQKNISTLHYLILQMQENQKIYPAYISSSFKPKKT